MVGGCIIFREGGKYIQNSSQKYKNGGVQVGDRGQMENDIKTYR
jgi:hypothetical protein